MALSTRGTIILGLDPGSLRTGFGLVESVGSKFAHIAHGTILLEGKKSLPERLRDLAIDLVSIVQQYQPTCAVIEDVFLYNNPRSALILGQARGAALAIMGLHGVGIHSLPPTRVKSLVCGRGRADKYQVAQFVALELNITVPVSRDASDALALALAQGYVLGTNLAQKLL